MLRGLGKRSVLSGVFRIGRRNVFVIAESTPNPDSIMFYPQGKDVLGNRAKTRTFLDKYNSRDSLLAASLFKVHGVHHIMLAPRHVTVTKNSEVEWDFVKPNVELVMSQFFAADLEVCKPESVEYVEQVDDAPDADAPSAETMEREIIKLVEERVQPFVQQDGGDVQFVKYESGVVHLKMMGACSGCPKSGITLNIQIKQLLQHYFPEITDVVEHEEDEEIPRARS